jgi:trehalose 6-phosphate phosphatase
LGIPSSTILLGLDFDGTLAPIVREPGRARPDPELVEVLARLAPRLRSVAVVSGRDTSMLSRLIPVPGLRLIGNHGLEEWRDGQATAIPPVQPYLPAMDRARRAIERLPELRLPGVELEVKLAIVSVHFRNAGDPIGTGRALKTVLEPIVAGCGLTLHAARLVWEIWPPVPVDKGAALRRLREELRPQGIIYVGDDVPDAAAFEALAAMLDVITLAVGVRSSEVAEETFSACDLILDGQPEVKRLLGSLLERAG